MKNNKKTMSIHDYNKKIDKIIASGKPVHEQLVDMLEMIGGKIIDCELEETQNVTTGIKKTFPQTVQKRTG